MRKKYRPEQRELTNAMAYELYFSDGITSPTEAAKRIKKHFNLEIGLKPLASRYRYQFAQFKKNRAFFQYCFDEGIDPKTVNGGWAKSNGKFSLKLDLDNTIDGFKEMSDELISRIKSHSPVYTKIRRAKRKDPHMLVVSMSDLHIGKLSEMIGDDYNIEIAVTRMRDALTSLLEKISGVEIEQVILLAGHDLVHVDSMANTTTRGTRQDASNTWNVMVSAAIDLMVHVIETLNTVAPVKVIWNNSNHDYHTGMMIGRVLDAWFRKAKDITFDISMKDRKYHRYGKVLIGSAHGDKAKEAQLPQLMANESADDWSKTRERVWILGHIHHRNTKFYPAGKDYIGVSVIYTRSLSGTDQWHSDQGYMSIKSLESFVFHPERGEVARFVESF